MKKYFNFCESLLERVEKIEKKLKNDYIGEVYCCDEYCQVMRVDSITIDDPNYYPIFRKFSFEDINDRVNGHIKISGCWFPKEDIIFYDDIYETKREKIMKKYASKDKK